MDVHPTPPGLAAPRGRGLRIATEHGVNHQRRADPLFVRNAVAGEIGAGTGRLVRRAEEHAYRVGVVDDRVTPAKFGNIAADVAPPGQRKAAAIVAGQRAFSAKDGHAVSPARRLPWQHQLAARTWLCGEEVAQNLQRRVGDFSANASIRSTTDSPRRASSGETVIVTGMTRASSGSMRRCTSAISANVWRTCCSVSPRAATAVFDRRQRDRHNRPQRTAATGFLRIAHVHRAADRQIVPRAGLSKKPSKFIRSTVAVRLTVPASTKVFRRHAGGGRRRSSAGERPAGVVGRPTWRGECPGS